MGNNTSIFSKLELNILSLLLHLEKKVAVSNVLNTFRAALLQGSKTTTHTTKYFDYSIWWLRVKSATIVNVCFCIFPKMFAYCSFFYCNLLSNQIINKIYVVLHTPQILLSNYTYSLFFHYV